jgi:hypothetical protein
MYRTETSKLLLNNRPGPSWPVNIGVRQGASSSPLLFNLVPEQLTRQLARNPNGISMGGRRISALLYADDLILLSNTNAGLHRLGHVMHRWARKYYLQVNNEKTEYIIFNSNGGAAQTLRIAGEDMKSQSTTTYLGFCRNKNSRQSHLKHRLARTRKGSGAV